MTRRRHQRWHLIRLTTYDDDGATSDAESTERLVSGMQQPANTALRHALDIDPTPWEEDSLDRADVTPPHKAYQVGLQPLSIVFSVVSFVSLCFITPSTFKALPTTPLITLVLDGICTLFFTLELSLKLKWPSDARGVSRYFSLIFQIAMLVFIVVSMVLQVLQIQNRVPSWVTVFRAPRALILGRVLQVITPFDLSFLTSVGRKGLHRLLMAMVFSLYFAAAAAVVGIQLYGGMDYMCMKNSTQSGNVSYSDLMIPGQKCSIYSENSSPCPFAYTCRNAELYGVEKKDFYFENIFYGMARIYQTSTFEGWAPEMFDCMRGRQIMYAVLYFVFVVVCVGFIAKNIFIAIMTDVLADLRNRLDDTFEVRPRKAHVGQFLKLTSDGSLVVSERGYITSRLRLTLCAMFSSVWTKLVVACLIIADAACQVGVGVWSQVGFTLLFDLEVVVKMIAFGTRDYLQNRMCLFELLTAVASTILVIPYVMGYPWVGLAFPLRLFRAVLLIPSMRAFFQRLMGSWKKLGFLVFFTFCVMIMGSAFSMHLFCYLNDFGGNGKGFVNFERSVGSIFTVMLMENWPAVYQDLYGGFRGFPKFFIVMYFVAFHIFFVTVLASVFVAVVTDNLDLDEDEKAEKQRRKGLDTLLTRAELPYHLRLYRFFPGTPVLVSSPSQGFETHRNGPRVSKRWLDKFLSADVDIATVNSVYWLLKRPGLVVNKVATILKGLPWTVADSLMSRIKFVSINISACLKHNSLSSKNTKHKFSGHSSSVHSNGSFHTSHLGYSLVPGDFDLDLFKHKMKQAGRKQEQLLEQLKEKHPLSEMTLFLFSDNNPLRQFCVSILSKRLIIFKGSSHSQYSFFSLQSVKAYIATQTFIEWIMVFLTQVSCVFMMLETPQKGTFRSSKTEIVEYLFFSTASVEMAMRLIAHGLLLSPKALLRKASGVLHLLIYLVSLVYVTWRPDSYPPYSLAHIVVILRCLRPLRLITLSPPLLRVLNNLLKGYRTFLKAALLVFVYIVVFSVYFCRSIGTRLEGCNDVSVKVREACIGGYPVPIVIDNSVSLSGRPLSILVPRVWSSPSMLSFKNFPWSYLVLHQALTLEGWTNLRDAIEALMGPSHTIMLHVYVFFGSMIGISLFIAVVVNGFFENKGTALLTVDQRRWCDLKKRLKLMVPLDTPVRPEDGTVKVLVYDVIVSSWYVIFYSAVVLLDIMALSFIQWIDPRHRYTTLTMKRITSGCFCFFILDIITKIIIYSPGPFFRSITRIFDLAITLLGMLWVVLYIIDHIHPTTIRYLDALAISVSILRFLALSTQWKSLYALVVTLVVSVLRSFYTLCVLVVLMVSYALVGMNLFGNTKFLVSTSPLCNFRNGWHGLFLLFRITTLDDWNIIMHDHMLSPPRCKYSPFGNIGESDCGNQTAAIVFFLSFQLCIVFILLNLLVAVVTETFSIFYSSEDNEMFTGAHIKEFLEAWRIVDKNKKNSITLAQAKFVLNLLDGRMGINLRHGSFMYRLICHELVRKASPKCITFHEMMFVLAFRSINIHRCLQLDEILAREEFESSLKEEVAKEILAEFMKGIRDKRKESPALESMYDIVGVQSELDETSALMEFRFPPSLEPDTCIAQLLSLSSSHGDSLSRSSSLSSSVDLVSFRSFSIEPDVLDTSDVEQWWQSEMAQVWPSGHVRALPIVGQPQ